MGTEPVPEPDAQESTSEVVATSRGPEVAVAAILIALGLLVISDSWRVGIGWADDGPRAGYFPFYIGLILIAAAGWVLVTTLLRWRTLDEVFVRRDEISGVWAVLWPSLIYVAIMPWTGIYVASALLIGFFMRRAYFCAK